MLILPNVLGYARIMDPDENDDATTETEPVAPLATVEDALKVLGVNLEDVLEDEEEADEADDSPEDPEEPEEDNESDSAEIDEDDDAPLFNGEQQQVFDKAIAKKTAKIKGLEERLAVLEAKQAGTTTQEATAPVAPSSDPLEATDAGKSILGSERQHQVWLDAATDLLNRFPGDPDTVLAELKEQHGLSIPEAQVESKLKGMISRFEREITRLQTRGDVLRETQAQSMAAARKAQTAQSLKTYPWLGDPKSAEFARAATILQSAPWLKSRADVSLVLGDLVTGQLARERAMVALNRRRAAGTPGRTLPSKVASKPTRGGVRAGGGSQTGKLLMELSEGDDSARVTLLKRMLTD